MSTDIESLPFIGTHRSAGKPRKARIFWRVSPTGDSAKDSDTGRRFALQYLAFREANEGDHGLLGRIVAEMPQKHTPIEISFLFMVDAAAAAGAGRARAISAYWDRGAAAKPDPTIAALHARAMDAWAGFVAWAKAGDFESRPTIFAELNALAGAMAACPADTASGIACKRELAGFNCEIDAGASMGRTMSLQLDFATRAALLASIRADEAALGGGVQGNA